MASEYPWFTHVQAAFGAPLLFFINHRPFGNGGSRTALLFLHSATTAHSPERLTLPCFSSQTPRFQDQFFTWGVSQWPGVKKSEMGQSIHFRLWLLCTAVITTMTYTHTAFHGSQTLCILIISFDPHNHPVTCTWKCLSWEEGERCPGLALGSFPCLAAGNITPGPCVPMEELDLNTIIGWLTAK